MANYLLIMTTVPNEEVAAKIAQKLVEERLAACITFSSPCQSYYWWEGKITQDKEFMLFIKTKANLYPELEKRLKELHPYSVPEILAFRVDQGSESYLSWLEKETKRLESEKV
ncbi:MAG: divalent-cation tolerance protein CutA [Candidatus Aminicenantes bacterium]|nr:divalent-cation tolerance protein CutA [Candidatus Aminicenantes bacterium]